MRQQNATTNTTAQSVYMYTSQWHLQFLSHLWKSCLPELIPEQLTGICTIRRPCCLQNSTIIEPISYSVGLNATSLHLWQQLNSQHRLTVHTTQLHHDAVTNLTQHKQSSLGLEKHSCLLSFFHQKWQPNGVLGHAQTCALHHNVTA